MKIALGWMECHLSKTDPQRHIELPFPEFIIMITNATSEPTIDCPHCRKSIKLTETLAAPFVNAAREEFDAKAAEREQAFRSREAELRERERTLDDRNEALEALVEERIAHERPKIEALAKNRVIEEHDLELQELRDAVAAKDKTLAGARQAELKLRGKMRELEERESAMELEKQRQLDDERAKIRAVAQEEMSEKVRLKESENNLVIEGLKSKIGDLQKRIEQGSQQLQGEAQEIDLELSLQRAFPTDTIEPIAKGQRGADCAQRVSNGGGTNVGTILWESKRTKKWSDSWVSKLRDDQRRSRADLAVIVTETLPKGIDRFGLVEGVWVTDLGSVVPLASALRHALKGIHGAHEINKGVKSKMEQLYHYLCGPEFRHRVEGIIEAFTTMKSDLETERRAMTKYWAKRERQLNQVLENTVGMHGELQAIGGGSIPAIENTEFGQIEGLSK